MLILILMKFVLPDSEMPVEQAAENQAELDRFDYGRREVPELRRQQHENAFVVRVEDSSSSQWSNSTVSLDMCEA